MFKRTRHVIRGGLVLVCTMPTLALAYPPGSTVSTGSNPIRSTAGVIDMASTYTADGVIAAPSGQDLVLTDIILGVSPEDNACYCSGQVRLEGSDGELYGSYAIGISHTSNHGPSSRQYSGPSGVRIPAGISISLQMVLEARSCGSDRYDLLYTLSGYLAKP